MFFFTRTHDSRTHTGIGVCVFLDLFQRVAKISRLVNPSGTSNVRHKPLPRLDKGCSCSPNIPVGSVLPLARLDTCWRLNDWRRDISYSHTPVHRLLVEDLPVFFCYSDLSQIVWFGRNHRARSLFWRMFSKNGHSTT